MFLNSLDKLESGIAYKTSPALEQMKIMGEYLFNPFTSVMPLSQSFELSNKISHIQMDLHWISWGFSSPDGLNLIAVMLRNYKRHILLEKENLQLKTASLKQHISIHLKKPQQNTPHQKSNSKNKTPKPHSKT